MSIAHDLSSEIAAAILVRKEETRKLEELKKIVLRVHIVLQKLTTQCREQNHKRDVSAAARSATEQLVERATDED